MHVTIVGRRDRFGRRLLTIDDDLAREVRRWSIHTWTEIVGMADGYTETVGPSHRLYPVLDALYREAQGGDDPNPFIAGHSFAEEQADGSTPRDYSTLVSTFGVKRVAEHGYQL
jgi:hypothetical protein